MAARHPESAATVVEGYALRHPHAPYDEAIEVYVNRFDGGGDAWQVQVFCHGALHDSDYFPTEVEALRWAAREAVTIAAAQMNPDPA